METKIESAVRSMMRSSTRGYLGTEMSLTNTSNENKKNKFPYVTFVMVAFDYDGSPLILLSDLSEHTKNLKKNNHVSILFYEEQRNLDFFPVFENKDKSFEYEDPMSRPRLTVTGVLNKSGEKIHKMRFINRHPVSKLYAGFSDMNIYKLDISDAHLTGGFAKVKWFNNKDLLYQNICGFSDDEMTVLDHMNKEHKQSVNLFAKNLSEKKSIDSDWNLIGIDPEGFDLRSSSEVKRYNFSPPLKKSSELRKSFIKLHKSLSET